jgi:probable rRNA maturation factor
MVEFNNLTSIKIKEDFIKNIVGKVLDKEGISDNVYVTLLKPEEIKIVICPHVVKENSVKFNTIFQEELAKVLVHGVLHLIGYEHNETGDKKMRQKEKLYLSEFLLKSKK